MNYEDTGEPFLRSYDWRRQDIVKNQLKLNGYIIDNERLFYSADFENWDEMSFEFNDPKYYSYYNTISPNVIWGITIKKQ